MGTGLTCCLELCCQFYAPWGECSRVDIRQGGATPQAQQASGGPLMEGIDLDALFAGLPAVLEADKAFSELLS